MLLDPQDADLLDLCSWFVHKGNGYVCGNVKINSEFKQKLLHRVIMERVLGRTLKGKEQVDHRNRIKTDNRRENLRVASKRQNSFNRVFKGSSQHPGVHWETSRSKWKATIEVDGKKEFLGRFNNELDAAKAYANRAKEVYGEFAPV